MANWSIVLNLVLLLGVVVTIGLLLKVRRQHANPHYIKPYVGSTDKVLHEPSFNDDIIAVRKVTPDHLPQEPKPKVHLTLSAIKPAQSAPLMLLLTAKENRQFAGYELLQTVLAAGLRFGDDHLFHKHQSPNGQGPVLCSLAAATATGVFDLQNIGAFSVRGLCLYMHLSNNPAIDQELFSLLVETAKQLCEGLDAHLLDSQRKPLDAARIERTMAWLQRSECVA